MIRHLFLRLPMYQINKIALTKFMKQKRCGGRDARVACLDVTSTTPTEVQGVLPVIVIFCLREYSQ